MGVKWNKPARTPTAERSTTPKIKASSTQRPKSLAALRKAKSASRSPGVTLPSWLRMGSRVRLSWEYDRAYGDGHATFDGKVIDLDNWIKVRNNDGVLCHMPLSMVKVERRVTR
jgi:hypothetical protein